MDIADLDDIPEPNEEGDGENNSARRRLRPLGMGETYDRLRSMGEEVRRNQDLVDQVLGNRRTLYDQLNDLNGLRSSTRELMGLTQYDPGIRVAGAALDALESPAMKIARGELNSPSFEAAMDGLSEATRPEPIKIAPPPVIHNPIHDTNELLAEQHETLAKMQVAIGQLAEHAAEERIDRKAEQEVARDRHKATLRATKLGAYAAVGAFVLSAAAVVIALTSKGPTEVSLSPQAVAQISGTVPDAAATPLISETPGSPASELPARSDELRPPW